MAIITRIGLFAKDLASPSSTLYPSSSLKKHHQKAKSGGERVLMKGVDMEQYKNERGVEIIANDLGVPYPGAESN